MAQNQPYSQYPYYTQPQNIYQQLGKPQPQPHLQSAYQQQHQQQLVHVPQQQQQQQYQYVYQHSQQQLQQQSQTQALQRAPSAHGFQPPPPQLSSYPGASSHTPQHSITQPQVYSYAHTPAPQIAQAPAPAQQLPTMYQRPPPQNSHMPTSSFPNLTHGQPMPNLLPRQLASNSLPVGNPAQLVPVSHRGPSPAISPGPPIAPSAAFAQQAQHQPPSMALVPANRTSMIAAPQRSGSTAIQAQAQTQTQTHPPPTTHTHPQPQLQSQVASHNMPQSFPQTQTQPQLVPSNTLPQRRPLPAPRTSRPFPPVNTNTLTENAPTRSALARTSMSQPPSPAKSAAPSPTKTNPSSPTKTSRPLPTPGGSLTKEGFAGVGAAGNSSRVTGLPIPSTVSSLMAGATPASLDIIQDRGKSPEKDGSYKSGTLNSQVQGFETSVKTGLPNPPPLISTSLSGPAGSSSTNSGLNRTPSKRRASPPRFQLSTTSIPSSPVKEAPQDSSSGRRVSATFSTASSTPGQPIVQPRSQAQQLSSQLSSTPPKQPQPNPSSTSNGPTPTQNQMSSSTPKKFTPVWKRTIPDYPQPAFGYAAGMVSEPFAPPTKPGPNTSPQKQAPAKTQIEMEKQRALVEQQHVERQINAAMAQAHAQAQAQQKAGTSLSNASHSGYALYSRSNPNLHQQPSQGQKYHVRSGAYVDDNDEDDYDDDDQEAEVETEETEEEQINARRRQHGKRASETSNGKKKATKEKERERERRVLKKPRPGSRSASASPKKRNVRKDITSTSSSSEVEMTETTGEEETEDDAQYYRHAKSSSVSSSRFKAKVEKEKEAMRRKRSSQPEYGEVYDDEDTPRKRDQSMKRRDSPPRQSHHQRDSNSNFTGFMSRGSPSPPLATLAYRRRASPSPPRQDRVSRRASPPRISLLKDAQRKTIKLRGDDDDDIDYKGRSEETDRWKKDERYRSRERDSGFADRERFASDRRYTENQHSYHREYTDDEPEYDRIRQQERDARYGPPRISSGASGATMARRRDADERENWSRSRHDEKDSSGKIFNLGREGSPTRGYTRGSGGYRSRPVSPTRNIPQQKSRNNSPPSLRSPYRSSPSSPSGAPERGLISKFSGINFGDRESESEMRGSGEWPADLPRLPRTPGEVSTVGAGGYFDTVQHQASRDAYSGISGSGSRGSMELARMSGRSSRANDCDFGNSSNARPLRRDTHNPQHYANLDMNLDDPPPRSLSPALSQGSSAYGRTSGSPQSQSQPFNRRPQSDIYSSMSNNSTPSQPSQRRKSLYDNTLSNPPSEPPQPIKHRPQSQVYDHPSPRPPSIHPLDRANMNTTNINNGTPKFQTINIESPAPVGGRDKRPDLDKMMSDPEDEGYNVPKVSLSGFSEHSSRGPRVIQVDKPKGPVVQLDSASGPAIQVDGPRGPSIQVDSPRMPVVQVASPRGPMIQVDSPRGPTIQVDSSQGPVINVESPRGPTINIESSPGNNVPKVQVYDIPGVSITGPEYDDYAGQNNSRPTRGHQKSARKPVNRGGLICGGCDGPIVGRIVSAMGARWHPQCFKCTVCNELLEHVSSYEHEGRPYCHLDYHENFAPRCFSCKTAIVEERFISLDDPALGKRTYHEQHFFCAECGDPFLAPSMNNSTRTGELSVKGDGEFESDDVGFTVYRGHPYCEACHVRLRLPKCKKCKKSIRDHEQAVEALGGKWCWACFVCASCENPFENPSFFQRGDKPYCEQCFDIMLRNEV